MNEISVYNAKPYDLRKKNKFKKHNFKTVYEGTETLSSLWPRIWEVVPDDI